jgi:hypothetical protein
MAYEEVMQEFTPIWAGNVNERVEGIIKAVSDGKFGPMYKMELIKPTKITLMLKDGDKETELDQGDMITLPSHVSLMDKLAISKAGMGSRYLIECEDEYETDYTDKEGRPVVGKSYKVLKWVEKKK